MSQSVLWDFCKSMINIRLTDIYHNILQTVSYWCRYESTVKISSWRSSWVRVPATDSSRAKQKTERYFPTWQLVPSRLSKISGNLNCKVNSGELKDDLAGIFSSHRWPNWLQIQEAWVDKQSFHKCHWCNDSIKQLPHMWHQIIF